MIERIIAVIIGYPVFHFGYYITGIVVCIVESEEWGERRADVGNTLNISVREVDGLEVPAFQPSSLQTDQYSFPVTCVDKTI